MKAVQDALRLLDVDDLVLGIQDVSFPGDDDEDLGRGTPYSRGAERFLAFAASLGFSGVQLGPQGLADRGRTSPYEGAVFSRNPLNLPFARLEAQGLLTPGSVAAWRAGRPPKSAERADPSYAFDASSALAAQLASRAPEALRTAADAFLARHAWWIVPDALYDALCEEHGQLWWREWSGPTAELDRRLFAPAPGEERAAAARLDALTATHAERIRTHALLQWLLTDEHRALRERCAALGLALFGDLQIGFSARDAWARQALFLRGYRMGAPPSRTNPDGQPWGYEVLAPGAGLAFVRARAERLFDEYDGIRIDHPHGWICPWVYRADDPDPFHAVQTGARLFSSPDVPGHEALRAFAIARPDQLSPGAPRHADDWVRWLDDGQVERYAVLIDEIVRAAAERGRPKSRLVCEVLSTLPYPVRRVLERHNLGRFRVMQKAKLDDPADVYRTENAAPEDWIMLGNHDTPTIWQVVEAWSARGELRRRADDVASRLAPEGARSGLAASLCEDPRRLVHALLADALASRARHVYVFFADLFGFREPYNVPGTIDASNWTLRAPRAFERAAAIDLREALALALRARGGEERLRLADALAAGA